MLYLPGEVKASLAKNTGLARRQDAASGASACARFPAPKWT